MHIAASTSRTTVSLSSTEKADTWRFATPHSPMAKNRTSTMDQPSILIEGGGHVWDAAGWNLDDLTSILPTISVAETKHEVDFVTAWMEERRAMHCFAGISGG